MFAAAARAAAGATAVAGCAAAVAVVLLQSLKSLMRVILDNYKRYGSATGERLSSEEIAAAADEAVSA